MLGALLLLVAARVLAVDVRRIPTSSMAPTLLGDDEAEGAAGDRVLVDRLTALLRSPRRFDVLALRHPFDGDREVVKRVVGLPRERIQVVDGDLVVNGTKYRKDAAEWRRVRIPLARASSPVGRAFEAAPGRVEEREGEPARFRAHDLAAAAPDSFLSLKRPVSDGWEDAAGVFHPGSFAVDDLEIEVTLRLSGAEAGIRFELQDRGDLFLLSLRRTARGAETLVEIDRTFPLGPGSGEGAAEQRTVRMASAPGPAWPSDRVVSISAANVDDRIRFEVDGAPAVPPVDYEDSHPVLANAGVPLVPRIHGARLSIHGGDAEIVALSVHRDLHWVASGKLGVREPYELGAGEWFVLGDRSSDSEDSRAFGGVRSDRILGVVRAIVAPLSRLGWVP